MIDKKLTELRKRLRKVSIEDKFQKLRDRAQEYRQYQPFEMGPHIQKDVIQNFTAIIETLKEWEYESAFKCLQFFKSKLNVVNRFSLCLFLYGKMMSDVIKVSIKNAVKAERQRRKEPNEDRVELQFIYQIQELLLEMDYGEARKEDFQVVLNAFWDVFRDNQLNVYEPDKDSLLVLSLRIVLKMLEVQTKAVFTSLKEIGLGVKLVSMLSSNLSLETDTITCLLVKILELYLMQEVCFYQNSEVCQVGGIYILGTQSNQKTILMAFCLQIITRLRQDLYLSSLNCLTIILKKYQFLVTSIKIQQVLPQFLKLTQHPNRQIKLKSLQVVDCMTFHAKDGQSQKFLGNMTLINILYNLLKIQNTYPDAITNDIVERISDIVSNVSTIRDKPLKHLFYQHPIWELAYQNIYDGSPLIEIIPIFIYLFEHLGGHTPVNLLENYIVSVASLNYNHIGKHIITSIRQTIQRSYQNSLDFWPQHLTQKFKNTLRQCNMYYLIEELVPEGDEEDPPI